MSMLYEAFEEEAKEIDVMDLMNEMMESFNQEKGYEPSPSDELRIRRMMLAVKYIEKERDRLMLLKKAVVEDWDKRIRSKTEDIDGLKGLIEKYLKDNNGGKNLTLDVGTASLRRIAPAAKVKDKEAARTYLEEQGVLNSFLKKPELDERLLEKTYQNDFNARVEAEAQIKIDEEIQASKNGKITKKREKEIKLEVEKEMADIYYSQLPDFLEYQPEEQKISIRMR